MIRHIALACALLVPTIASAQTASATGAPVVFLSIFGPEASIKATMAKVKELGGTIPIPRLEVPGRVVLAVFKDPAGNSVGLVELSNGKPKVPPAK
jgi:predicted enzyme related to lactoylglutathione lyase